MIGGERTGEEWTRSCHDAAQQAVCLKHFLWSQSPHMRPKAGGYEPVRKEGPVIQPDPIKVHIQGLFRVSDSI